MITKRYVPVKSVFFTESGLTLPPGNLSDKYSFYKVNFRIVILAQGNLSAR